MSAGALRARRGRDRVTPKTALPADRRRRRPPARRWWRPRAAARCNFFTKPYLGNAAVRRAVCLAGAAAGLEPLHQESVSRCLHCCRALRRGQIVHAPCARSAASLCAARITQGPIAHGSAVVRPSQSRLRGACPGCEILATFRELAAPAYENHHSKLPAVPVR